MNDKRKPLNITRDLTVVEEQIEAAESAIDHLNGNPFLGALSLTINGIDVPLPRHNALIALNAQRAHLIERRVALLIEYDAWIQYEQGNVMGQPAS